MLDQTQMEPEQSSPIHFHDTMTTPRTSFEKMLQVLEIIGESSFGLTFDQLHSAMRLTRSTLYRHLKVLTDAGLITSLPNVGYTLGPRIAELDYRMRTQDPLIIVSRPIMEELVQTMPGIALLCRKYKDKVLCVHQTSSTASFRTGYERGRNRPLSRGSASRVILANLPPRTIARLFQHYEQAFREADLGNSLAEVKASLGRIRQQGWDVTAGQVTSGVTGIAAPIFDSQAAVIGSLNLTIGRAPLDEEEVRAIAERVTFCAKIITKMISQNISEGTVPAPIRNADSKK